MQHQDQNGSDSRAAESQAHKDGAESTSQFPMLKYTCSNTDISIIQHSNFYNVYHSTTNHQAWKTDNMQPNKTTKTDTKITQIRKLNIINITVSDLLKMLKERTNMKSSKQLRLKQCYE